MILQFIETAPLWQRAVLSFLLIEDLDRARDGAIQVPQQPMLDALAAMT